MATLVLIATTWMGSETSIAYAATPEVVLNKPIDSEFLPSASDGYFVWSANSAADPTHFYSYVMADGGSPVRVDDRSIGASIDGTTIVYKRGHNLRFFDAVTHVHSAPPPGVNTPNLEYRASLSGKKLLFTRSNANRAAFDKAWLEVVLFNTATKVSTVLRKMPYRTSYLVSDQVNGNWATFESCHEPGPVFSNCQVYRYRISTGVTERIENPGLQQYGASVSRDGTVYLMRAPNRRRWNCGKHTQIFRNPVGGPGVLIYTFPEGRDMFSSFTLDETDGSATLYFDKGPCKPGGGIYRITNADTTT